MTTNSRESESATRAEGGGRLSYHLHRSHPLSGASPRNEGNELVSAAMSRSAELPPQAVQARGRSSAGGVLGAETAIRRRSRGVLEEEVRTDFEVIGQLANVRLAQLSLASKNPIPEAFIAKDAAEVTPAKAVLLHEELQGM